MSTKLRRIGCSDRVIMWFISYLNNRKQRVAVRGTLSDEHSFLNLIYIDDLVQALKHCSITMFADDTTFYMSTVRLY